MAADSPTFHELMSLFPLASGSLPRHQLVCDDAVPEPYHQLLVHPHHMTVAVEAFFGGLVTVRVLHRRHDGDLYARQILLEHPRAGVVLFGVVRIRLSACSEAVRDAILAESAPLGRILIEHDVLRTIEPTAMLRLEVNSDLASITNWSPSRTYGRLGIIHCDGQSAVELLEILAPIVVRST